MLWMVINSVLLNNLTATPPSKVSPWNRLELLAILGIIVIFEDSVWGLSVICCYVEDLEKLQFQRCWTKFSRQLLQCEIFSAMCSSISSLSLDAVAGSPDPTWSLLTFHFFLSHSNLAGSTLGSWFRHPPPPHTWVL